MSAPTTDSNPLALGGHFVLDGDSYTTKQYVSLETLLAIRHHDGQEVPVAVRDIVKQHAQKELVEQEEGVESSGTESVTEGDWKAADERRTKLIMLVEAEHPTRKLAQEVAKQFGRSVSTIYRWRTKWLSDGKIVDLVPHHPTGGRGKARIDKVAEAIQKEVIDEFYMTKQRRKPAKVMKEIKARCKRAGVRPPHINTLRRRLAAISEREKKGAREGKSAGKKYQPVRGTFPDADYPNAVWQIDHTPVDVCIVDDKCRRNIGRVWITVAIDVFSRCVVGFYLSLDKPNATSVGMCLVHAILPKQGWLAAHGIAGSWPMWGKPLRVHADNDKTFRCEMVTRAAKQHRIDLEWRPVRTPHWGGHIERLLGTFNEEIHTLPGTTFSSPEERGDYKPHEEAVLNFAELETYITNYIIGDYHVGFHSAISRPPIKRYEAGLLGDGVLVGRGMPEPERDPARLRIDFLPLKERTVQSFGVVWDDIGYYDPVLDPWIHSMDPERSGKKRKFICRRDPRDISSLWFLDPEKDIYFKIPYKNQEYPSINLWELKAIKRQLVKEGHAEVNEALIFDTYERQQALLARASQTTQAARKEEQKKKVNEKKLAAEKAQVDAALGALDLESRHERQPSAVDDWTDADVVVGFRKRTTDS